MIRPDFNASVFNFVLFFKAAFAILAALSYPILGANAVTNIKELSKSSSILFLSAFSPEIQYLVIQIVERIVVDEVSGSYLMFEIFPKDYTHIGFTSITSFVEFFGFEHSQPAARIAMEHAFGDRAFKTMNLLSTYYLGEAWANFGILGVILSPIYVGLVIGLSATYLRNVSKSPTSVALMSYMVLPSSISSQFNNFLINPTFLIIGCTFLILRSMKLPAKI